MDSCASCYLTNGLMLPAYLYAVEDAHLRQHEIKKPSLHEVTAYCSCSVVTVYSTESYDPRRYFTIS